jgi:hypothetical protein
MVGHVSSIVRFDGGSIQGTRIKYYPTTQSAIKAPHGSLATETRVELLLHPEFKRTPQSVSDEPSSRRDC